MGTAILRRSLSNHSLNNDNRLAFWLLFPTVVYLLLVMVLPLLWAISISFTDKMVGKQGVFNGIDNYLLLLRDKVFFKAVTNTLFFTFVAVLLKVVFGVSVALILNEPLRARNLYRAIILLPWTLPALVVIFAWRWMFSDVGGVLNDLLRKAGIISVDIGWLSASGTLAMFSIIMVNVWRGTPFIAISALAGLQTISSDLYASATIDGANAPQKFYYITLPSIKNVLLLAALVSTIWTLNNFQMVWLLTAGGPGDSTHIIATYSYVVGFSNRFLGRAVSVSVLAMPFIIVLVNYITKITLKDN